MESFTTDAGMRIWVEYPDMSGASEGVPLVVFVHAETPSLSVLCALENIDCSKGVGVAGYSQGAAIGSRAAMNDDRVTAFLGVGLNTIFLYTDDGAAEATCFRDATP